MSYGHIDPHASTGTLMEVWEERGRQDARWGEQNHPDGTGGPDIRFLCDLARIVCDTAHKDGKGSWRHILQEEVFEAFGEEDPSRLRAELIQVAAVASAWVEAIDRRDVTDRSEVSVPGGNT